MIRIINNASIRQAEQLLAAGELVALPTETVYGLAADAYNETAVQKIFMAKGRPNFNPLITHVADIAMAERHVEIGPLARSLMENFWPGPLTLVLPRHADSLVAPTAYAGLPFLALRQPQGIILELTRRLNRPLVAPSANKSGFLSTTTAQAVAQAFEAPLALILDGGPCCVGVESTILKIDQQERVYLLRAGGLALDRIEALIKKPIITTLPLKQAIEAPGMLTSHYAPRKEIRINATYVQKGELLLAFGPQRIRGYAEAVKIINLSRTGDLDEAANRLFEALRELDQNAAGQVIVVEPVPLEGLGLAINDRLQRAAAPRKQ